MCFHPRRSCECGASEAYLFYKDNLMPEDVLAHLYCPRCAADVAFDPASMLEDGGWIIEFDMELAWVFFRNAGFRDEVTPETIFDGQYCGWYGLSPTDIAENLRMHDELNELKRRRETREFMGRIKEMRLEHVARLKSEGWRRALSA